MKYFYLVVILIVLFVCSIICNVLLYDNVHKARRIIQKDSILIKNYQEKGLKDSIHVCPPSYKIKYIYEKQKNSVILDSVIVENMPKSSISTELDKILAEEW